MQLRSLTAPNVGNVYVITATAVTDRDKQAEKAQWAYFKETHYYFKNTKTALKKMPERIIDESYHTSGNAALTETGFGAMDLYEILQRLCTMHRKGTIQDIESNLLTFQQPMERNSPVEFMLRGIEAVQMFLIDNPEEGQELTQVYLISYRLIKV